MLSNAGKIAIMRRRPSQNFRLVLGASVLFCLPLITWAQLKSDAPPRPSTIPLVIDYRDGVEKHFTAIAWKEGLTVLDVLSAAKASPHGITFASTGSGETTFVNQIDDLKNEGARGGRRNWTYEVNGKLADRSAAVYVLKSGDRVRWSFTDRKVK